MTAVDARCPCDPARGLLCDDCVGLVEHLNHQTPRLCAYRLCSKPLVRRDGEQPWHFKRRTCCDASCSSRKAHGSTAPLDLPGHKTCAECGATTYRRDGESPNRWLAREFCSRQCASRHTIRKNTQQRTSPPAAQVKACAGCRGEMRRKSGERMNKWRERRFCSWGCRYGGPPGPRPEASGVRETKPCVECGADVVRPAKYSTKNWEARKYCSRRCASAAGQPFRKEPQVAPSRDRKPAPLPTPVPVVRPVVRPRAEDLITDPAVVDMDRKRRTADTLLDEGITPERVAVELGVSVALVRRWDRGDQ